MVPPAFDEGQPFLERFDSKLIGAKTGILAILPVVNDYNDEASS
jgi:hypothetical protein